MKLLHCFSVGLLPIFEVLLERGARTRIVNNKGQSVLSLASSHLSPHAIALVEAAEAAEGDLDAAWMSRLDALPDADRPLLRSGGWLDFAATHPDPAQAEGLVLRTEDGGKTWKEVYRSGRPFELIWKASFPEGGATGYATVQSYDPERATQLVIRSDDRGKTWREIEMAQDKTARQFGIGFVSKDVGFVGTAAGGFATKDGGQTWERVPIARAANKFQAVPTGAGVRLYAIGTEVQATDLPR